MGLTSEDMECCVCLQSYSRRDKTPRMLHCKHTFCGQCLQALSRLQSGLLMVCCPLCRWITCTRASLPIAGSLWVNTDIWDRITERQEEEEQKEKEENLWMTENKQTQTSTQCVCPSSRNRSLWSKLRTFLRKLRFQNSRTRH
ncbi:RING finger protein 223-like [Esox lucius]|uniref:RING finger protein 223-like n=1 Tax=Esox lucius TaxID=8010 RepID=UPI001477618F|nr:RING finger protein 223-like [Esox lucius]